MRQPSLSSGITNRPATACRNRHDLETTANHGARSQPQLPGAGGCPLVPACRTNVRAGGREGTREDVKAKRRPAHLHCQTP